MIGLITFILSLFMIRVILEYNEDIDNSSEKTVKNKNDDYEFQLKFNK